MTVWSNFCHLNFQTGCRLPLTITEYHYKEKAWESVPVLIPDLGSRIAFYKDKQRS